MIIKMKHSETNSSMYIDFEVENNCSNPKLEDGDYVRILKYKNIFATKCCTPNWLEEGFMIKNTVSWTYEIENLNGEESVKTFYENELQKTKQTEIRIEKTVKKKDAKLNVKHTGYDNQNVKSKLKFL